MDRPLLVLSDVHLSRDYGASIGTELARVLRQYPDCELVLAGDILDLSLDSAEISREASLRAALAPHTEVVTALREHIARGQKLTFLPGNHDAGLGGGNAGAEALRKHLGAERAESIEVASWFVRRGGVHIEHGHLYDPDCAPNHPLARPNARSEGLGTALMRRFVAPHDALFLAHKNQLTPVSGFKMALHRWGKRAPWVVLDYFKTAVELCWEAERDKTRIANKQRAGNRLTEVYAQHTGVPRQVIEALLRFAPVPTHHSLGATFLRLYFDRVFAIGALGAGLSILSAAGLSLAVGSSLVSPLGTLSKVGALLTTLGGGYLAGSTALEKNRYADRVIGQLGRAAHQVRAITEAELVVFGHTHVEVNEPGYVNLGSFGYGRPKKPFLLVGTDGQSERRYAPT